MSSALFILLFALLAITAQEVPQGGISSQEKVPSQETVAPEDKAESVWEYLLIKYDSDNDGRVSAAEYARDEEHWKRLDKNADGFLDRDEFARSAGRGTARDRSTRGGQRGVRPEAPKVGSIAPDFDLLVLPKKKLESAKSESRKEPKKIAKPEFVKLSSFKGKKPVALIFGSYT